MPRLNIGSSVPSFRLPSAHKDKYAFEDYRLKHKNYWHLIVFFRGSWSLACTEELQKLESEKEELKNHNLLITAISTDSLQNLELFVEKYHLTFPVLSDEFFTIGEAFDVFQNTGEDPYNNHCPHHEPAHFIVNQDGILLYQQKQSAPFGRPSPCDICKNVDYLNRLATQVPKRSS
ncbi:peroxiredoxin family protein [Halobacillus campisalis]|uniref:Peroxiredoxin family protein n=1 Tax=Halobacillus campisalis TaxID=435909 RepID=A0ABW2K4B0_9BACI|nr:redoxin domain-containing protein [Halobacillus campisalis]